MLPALAKKPALSPVAEDWSKRDPKYVKPKASEKKVVAPPKQKSKAAGVVLTSLLLNGDPKTPPNADLKLAEKKVTSVKPIEFHLTKDDIASILSNLRIFYSQTRTEANLAALRKVLYVHDRDLALKLFKPVPSKPQFAVSEVVDCVTQINSRLVDCRTRISRQKNPEQRTSAYVVCHSFVTTVRRVVETTAVAGMLVEIESVRKGLLG